MGAPKGSSRLLQRIGRANHRLDQASRALLVPGNRFEFLEATAAEQAVVAGQRDGEAFRPGGLEGQRATEDIARELERHAGNGGWEIGEGLQDFIEGHSVGV